VYSIPVSRAPDAEFDFASDFGEQRVVSANPDIFARVHFRAPLPHENASCGNDLTAETLYT